jgi:hypothetical protein
MRVTFVAPTVAQLGYGTFYRGLEYQRGAGLGSLFRGLVRFLAPLAKSVVKGIGKEALRSVGNIAKDVADGADLRSAAQQHLQTGAKQAVRRSAAKVARAMKGKGLGRAPPNRKLVPQAGKSTIKGKPRKPRKRATKQKDTLGYFFP